VTVVELALVALQFTLFIVVGWSVASLAIARFFADVDLEWPERALFAIGGACVFSIAIMILHIASGGAIFNNAIVVPVVALVTIVLTARTGAWRVTVPWKPVIAAVLLLFALFVIPMFAAGSTVREGDPPWHMAWTHELLDGQPLPDGHAPAFARNAYPWGWHGILATVTRLVPGGTPLLAHEALHVVLVLAIPVAAACLARRVRRDAGWYGAGAASLIGGFGWLSAMGQDFVATPTEARHGADMVVASPNSIYELFPPALPREMGLVLLGLTGTLLLYAVTDRRKSWWYAAGIASGSAALVSFPMLISAVMWIAVAALAARGERVRVWLRVMVPTVVLFALWLGPLVYWYVTEGGFVDVVPVLGREWPLPLALSAWGILFPLAVVGVWLLVRSRTLEAKVLLGFAAASVAAILLAMARRRFGWGLQGNQTLLHQGRMWPVAHLLGAAFAGVALAHHAARFARRRAIAVRVATAGLLAFGSISLLLSIPALSDLIAERDKGFVYADEDLAAGSFMRAAADHLSSGDILISDDYGLAFKLFEFSGVSLGEYDDPRLDDNDARIRYRDLADRYIETMRSGGFRPTHVVAEERSAPQGEVLETGEYEGRRWALVKVSDQE
jgi:hypothetical protein